jgi:hypothetical protein
MRLVALCALAALTLAVDGAAAATNYYLNTRDPSAATTCTAQGGTVQTDGSGRKMCVFPQQTCAPATLPYVINPNDPYAAQTCASQCGTIVLNTSGQRVCTSTSSMREPPNTN